MDGFPRNVSQAEFLNTLLTELKQQCDVALNLEVPDATLVERLLSRGRKDDNQETIRRRLEVYREQTAPVIDFYQKQGSLKSVDGDRSLEEVTAALEQAIAS